MDEPLKPIAEQLRDANKKAQLIYAFNGVGKTRLSRTFKKLVAPKDKDDGEYEPLELPRSKILYYNAFTEDLFYWDNDLKFDADPRMRIQPNSFTDWILRDQGQDFNIISKFQYYTNNHLTPHFRQSSEEHGLGKAGASAMEVH